MTRRRVAFWAVTAPVCFAFAYSGVANLAHLDPIARDMIHLGYPRYFSTILGAWKLLGVVAIVAPGLERPKEWAYAGMFFDLSGAAISREVMGDGGAGVAPPLLLAGLVVASWALRPSNQQGASS